MVDKQTRKPPRSDNVLYTPEEDAIIYDACENAPDLTKAVKQLHAEGKLLHRSHSGVVNRAYRLVGHRPEYNHGRLVKHIEETGINVKARERRPFSQPVLARPSWFEEGDMSARLTMRR